MPTSKCDTTGGSDRALPAIGLLVIRFLSLVSVFSLVGHNGHVRDSLPLALLAIILFVLGWR